MANDIVISDEYSWSASSGIFEWVVRFLLQSVDDPYAQQQLNLVLDARLGVLDVTSLPEAGRDAVLRSLRKELTAAAEMHLVPLLQQPAVAQRFTIGHVRVLALMAEDLATRGTGTGREG